MKVEYQAKKKQRINSQFLTGFRCDDANWWYNEKHNLWEYLPNFNSGEYRSHRKCKSVRAFRRMLKKAPYGVSFTLVSKWYGYDIVGIGSYEYKSITELELITITGMTTAEDLSTSKTLKINS